MLCVYAVYSELSEGAERIRSIDNWKEKKNMIQNYLVFRSQTAHVDVYDSTTDMRNVNHANIMIII